MSNSSDLNRLHSLLLEGGVVNDQTWETVYNVPVRGDSVPLAQILLEDGAEWDTLPPPMLECVACAISLFLTFMES